MHIDLFYFYALYCLFDKKKWCGKYFVDLGCNNEKNIESVLNKVINDDAWMLDYLDQ